MSILQDFIAQFSALRYQNPLAQKILATRALLSQHFALDSADMSKFDKLLSELNAPLKVAVIGQFSSGKSTFLNALLGEEILPSGIIPLTSKVCEIGYGENLHLEIFYKDGTHSFAPLDFLERADPLINAQISHYKLFAPLPLLQEITFLDTPGFNSQNQEDTEVSNAILQEVDGIIWVSLIDNVGKNSEREILYNHIRHYRAKSLCVLNQKDRLKNAAEIETSLNYAREAFSGIFEEIIAISAKNALSAKTQSNSQRAQQLYEDSAIVEVFEFLHTHLMPQKAQNKEHRTLYALRALVLKYYRRLHIPQIYLRRLEGILEGYGALDSMQAQALNAQSQQLFSLLESRLLTLTQQIFSEITRVTMTFSKSAKNALGLKTTQMYEKEVYVLPLDSVLNALQRQDSPLIAEWHKLFLALKQFGVEFVREIPSFGELLQEWEKQALGTHPRGTPLFLPYVLSLPVHLQEWLVQTHTIALDFSSAMDRISSSLHAHTHELAQLLDKTLKNAIKLVCLELDSKITKGVQAYQKDSQRFPLYEPSMENIRDMLQSAIGLEYYQERLFLHNNIAKALVREIESTLASVREEHLERLRALMARNDEILGALKLVMK
ncbi:dynamin family protein [uncultured Helicobacter sp.]|uniref:dynamin family protein n=1 Tax=uncultured Helicobacter sp. TaxID=175537 RepID=UPI00375310B2